MSVSEQPNEVQRVTVRLQSSVSLFGATSTGTQAARDNPVGHESFKRSRDVTQGTILTKISRKSSSGCADGPVPSLGRSAHLL